MPYLNKIVKLTYTAKFHVTIFLSHDGVHSFGFMLINSCHLWFYKVTANLKGRLNILNKVLLILLKKIKKIKISKGHQSISQKYKWNSMTATIIWVVPVQTRQKEVYNRVLKWCHKNDFSEIWVLFDCSEPIWQKLTCKKMAL